MQRLAERSLQADPEAVRTYVPEEVDLRIAEELLGGAILQVDIAREIGVDAAIVSRVLRDPVRSAYICQQVTVVARQRIGLVDAALVNKAISGDVRAIDLYYKRFDKLVSRSVNVNINTHGSFDPSQLTDDELKTLADQYAIKEAKKQAKDADFEESVSNVPKKEGT